MAKDVDKIPGVVFEDDVDENIKPIDDKFRSEAIKALQTVNQYVVESSPFKPRERSNLKKVQDDVLGVLEKDGYDTRNPAVQLAVSLLIDNLSRQ